MSNNNTEKMSLKQEAIIGLLTLLSTAISTEIIIDFVLGITVYTASRLFYHYFGGKITVMVDKLKALCKKRIK